MVCQRWSVDDVVQFSGSMTKNQRKWRIWNWPVWCALSRRYDSGCYSARLYLWSLLWCITVILAGWKYIKPLSISRKNLGRCSKTRPRSAFCKMWSPIKSHFIADATQVLYELIHSRANTKRWTDVYLAGSALNQYVLCLQLTLLCVLYPLTT